MIWHTSNLRLGNDDELRKNVLNKVKDCPVCNTVLDFIEMSACELIRLVKPDVDRDFCKKVLRSRITEGKSPEEIARMVGVDVETLKEAIKKATEITEEAYMEALGKKNK